jgi:HTH-type transcriptional regulator/antitoxin HigA
LRIISKKILREFWEKHSNCEQQLKSWYQEISKGNWENPNDIKKEYPTVSFLNNNRLVFNIKGNSYRLIIKINYEYQIIWIRFIGTHTEYDKIDAGKFKEMTIKPIKNEKDYQDALARLEVIFDSRKGSKEGDELEILSILIEKYEDEHFPIEFSDPIEAIKFRMEQMGYTQSDLARLVGLKSRASEILNRRRKLSLEMIRKLHDSLKIPTEVLIQDY